MDVEVGIDQLFIRCSGTDAGSIPLKLIQQIENLIISSRNALHHLLSTEDDFLDGQGLVFVLFSHVFLLSW